MFMRMTLVVPVISILAGCAAYEPPALTADHPAYSDAMAAQEPPRSMTLSYKPSVKERPGPVQMAQGMPHGERGMTRSMGGMHDSASPKPHGMRFEGEGTVVAVVPGTQVVLDHKAITGFMDAMTMGYKVDPPSVLKGLKPGDRVHFTIDAGKNAVVAIEKLQ